MRLVQALGAGGAGFLPRFCFDVVVHNDCVRLRRPTHLRRRVVAGRMFGESMYIEKDEPGSYSEDGTWRPGQTMQTHVIGTTQAPTSGGTGRLRDDGTKGARLAELRAFYIPFDDSDPHSLVSSPQRLRGSDRVIYRNSEYRIMSVETWDNHYKVFADRMEDTVEDVPNALQWLGIQLQSGSRSLDWSQG